MTENKALSAKGQKKRGRQRKNTTNSKTKGKNRLSWIIKPEYMTHEQWQRALRKQLAAEESFGIECVDDKSLPGEYLVRSAKTKQEYKVVYRGENSPWNYCSCMDFKTSQLGTCKHIESVKLWIGESVKRHVRREIPPYTSVYLSYLGERTVRIRIGSDHQEEYRQLASQYFNASGEMLYGTYLIIDEFIAKAKAISDTFRIYQDAVDFIIEKREESFRSRIIERYSDEDLDRLLTTKLYPYQKNGIRFAFAKGKSIIADEMGLGKTIQAIGAAELLRKEKLIQSALIICPTSLKYQWKREIERFTGQHAHVIEGLNYRRIGQYGLDVPYKIISYNSACNDVITLGKLETDLLIMDEVQRLKNWETKISKTMRRIVSQYAVILSGTPLENKMEELYSVMEFADQYCLAPFWKFKTDCIVTDSNGKVIGYRNLNMIGEKTRERLIRRTKKQVALQMPERQDKNLFVPMTEEQRGSHEELKMIIARIIQKWKHTHFLSETDRNRLLVSLSKMRMLCDSTYILDQKTRFDTKVDEVINIITSIIETEGEKVVVFSQWERMTRLISYELEKRNIGFEYLHGGVPSEQRGKLINNFADNPDSRVFLSTDAGSTGLNLQSAATVINLDLPWNPAVLEQRIARIYRLGQQRNVQVINLIAADTIEERMLDKLRFKSAMFEGVLDNGEDTIFLGDGSKLTEMLETISDMIDNSDTAASSQDIPSAQNSEKSTDETTYADNNVQTELDFPPAETSAKDNGAVVTDTEKPREEKQPTPATGDDETDDETDDDNMPESGTSAGQADNPQELIKHGTAFLSGLAATLKSPEATRQLVDTLVHTDKETGRTTLNIPVPDKQSVQTLLDIVGKLFG